MEWRLLAFSSFFLSLLGYPEARFCRWRMFFVMYPTVSKPTEPLYLAHNVVASPSLGVANEERYDGRFLAQCPIEIPSPSDQDSFGMEVCDRQRGLLSLFLSVPIIC